MLHNDEQSLGDEMDCTDDAGVEPLHADPGRAAAGAHAHEQPILDAHYERAERVIELEFARIEPSHGLTALPALNYGITVARARAVDDALGNTTTHSLLTDRFTTCTSVLLAAVCADAVGVHLVPQKREVDPGLYEHMRNLGRHIQHVIGNIARQRAGLESTRKRKGLSAEWLESEITKLHATLTDMTPQYFRPPPDKPSRAAQAATPSRSPAAAMPATMSSPGHHAERTPREASLQDRLEHVVCAPHSLTEQRSSHQQVSRSREASPHPPRRSGPRTRLLPSCA